MAAPDSRQRQPADINPGRFAARARHQAPHLLAQALRDLAALSDALDGTIEAAEEAEAVHLAQAQINAIERSINRLNRLIR